MRDSEASQILTVNASVLFKKIKAAKIGKAAQINKLVVGKEVFRDEEVADGFFQSISNLKSLDSSAVNDSPSLADFSSDFRNILIICKLGAKIPDITKSTAFTLMMNMKPDVNDYFGLTPNHFIYAGPAGWDHFHLLLTTLAKNVESTDITEINTVYACILF